MPDRPLLGPGHRVRRGGIRGFRFYFQAGSDQETRTARHLCDYFWFWSRVSLSPSMPSTKAPPELGQLEESFAAVFQIEQRLTTSLMHFIRLRKRFR